MVFGLFNLLFVLDFTFSSSPRLCGDSVRTVAPNVFRFFTGNCDRFGRGWISFTVNLRVCDVWPVLGMADARARSQSGDGARFSDPKLSVVWTETSSRTGATGVHDSCSSGGGESRVGLGTGRAGVPGTWSSGGGVGRGTGRAGVPGTWSSGGGVGRGTGRAGVPGTWSSGGGVGRGTGRAGVPGTWSSGGGVGLGTGRAGVPGTWSSGGGVGRGTGRAGVPGTWSSGGGVGRGTGRAGVPGTCSSGGGVGRGTGRAGVPGTWSSGGGVPSGVGAGLSVTSAGLNSLSSNTRGLTGKIPDFLKPETALFTFAALPYASPNNLLI